MQLQNLQGKFLTELVLDKLWDTSLSNEEIKTQDRKICNFATIKMLTSVLCVSGSENVQSRKWKSIK